jgi:polysaccharide export outer membrane protein
MTTRRAGRRSPRATRTALAAAAVLSLMAFARPSSVQPLPVDAESCPGDYVIGAEDVLEVAVWNNATITRTVPVRPDGKISLPLLDDVQASGLTTTELRERLAKALTVYIPSPSVSVIVREIHSFKVTVMGEVKTPGRYELKDRATVLDVLAMAGGLNEYAARSRIVVLRQDGVTTRRIRFAYEAFAGDNRRSNGKSESSPAQDNLCLRPGDIILVP